MTLSAVLIPDWITWDTQTVCTLPLISHPSLTHPQPYTKKIHYTYGLHSRCSSLANPQCTPFPEPTDCAGPDRTFCSLWRTAGFLMSFSVILELAGLVGFAVVLLGGKQARESGWKVVLPLVLVAAAAQVAGMGIVGWVFERDGRFFEGWKLGRSWVLCTVSWVVEVAVAVGVGLATWWLPEEGGYELIPEGGRTG